jgi:RNA polymerase sigma factor for flagellar operon FliA
MEPQTLWKEYFITKDPQLKEKLIKHYVFLVRQIVGKMSSSLPLHIEKDDLTSYGIFGLLEAIERFNPNLGVPFAGFAYKRIRGAIIDGIRKEDWLPISVRQRAKQVEQAYEKIEKELGRSATDDEIAAELGINENELGEWLKAVQIVTILSLDQSFGEDEGFFLKNNLWDENSPNPLQMVLDYETKQILVRLIDKLPEKEKLVISLYYYSDLSNKEIAEIMNLSPSRISQLHTKAIFRLRGKLVQLKNSKVG